MSSSLAARRGAPAALALLAAAVLFIVSFGASPASATPATSGNAKFALGTGKAGKALVKSGVKVKRVAPAKVNRKGKRFVAKLPVRGLSTGARSDVDLKGGFVLRRGKRVVRITRLNLAVLKSGKVGLGGVIQRLGGKKPRKSVINVFNVRGKARVSTQGRKSKLRINGGKVSFTAAVVKAVGRHLGLKRVPRGQIASLNVNAVRTDAEPVDPCVANPDAEGCPFVDPYVAECNVPATAKVAGTIKPAGPLPEFAATPGTSGPADLAWGFKNSFRNYVTTIAGGSIHVLNGAAATGSAPSFSGFEFPASGFRYSDGGTPSDLADDKAVLEGSGTALFCATGHEFRVALSSPTLVIDGENSRIDADIDANLSGTWIPTQRITLATLDPSGTAGRVQDGDGSTINWTDVPAALTAEGSQAICGVGELDKCSGFYPAGTPLEPISLAVATDVEVDQFQEQCGLLPTSKIDDARTPAAPLPEMSGAEPTTGPTGIAWGFKSSLRGYVFGFNPAKGLQALDGATRAPGMDSTRGFVFPVADGSYLANDEGDTSDDQAVINGTGTALFCNSPHGFWASISNPTIVIDGENSRIVADVSSNETGVWKTTERVDLAELDLTGITPAYEGDQVTWGAIPATLAAGAAPFATYPADEQLDPITVAVTTSDAE